MLRILMWQWESIVKWYKREPIFKGIDKITIPIFEVWNQMVTSTGWKQRQVMESRGEMFLFVRI